MTSLPKDTERVHNATKLLKTRSANPKVNWNGCIYVYADGVVRKEFEDYFRDNVDLTPLGIIKRFDLFNLDLTKTTNYGHFGKEELPWESVDLFTN